MRPGKRALPVMSFPGTILDDCSSKPSAISMFWASGGRGMERVVRPSAEGVPSQARSESTLVEIISTTWMVGLAGSHWRIMCCTWRRSMCGFFFGGFEEFHLDGLIGGGGIEVQGSAICWSARPACLTEMRGLHRGHEGEVADDELAVGIAGELVFF